MFRKFVPVAILSLFPFIIRKAVNGSLEISDPPVELQQCVSRTEEELFCDASSVYVVQDDHTYYDVLTLSPKILHVFIDVYQSIRGHTWGYGKNFLILAQNVSSLSILLENLKRCTVWHPQESAIGRFLVVTLSQDIEMVFKLLWKLNIVNALVVVEEKQGYYVYSSDPFHPNNNCGTNVQKLLKQSCSGLAINFPKPIRNLNRCLIAFEPFVLHNFVHLTLNISFVYLTHALNVTIMHVNERNMEIIRSNNIATMICIVGKNLPYGKLQVSSEIYRDYFVYASPVDHNMFTLDVIAAIFQYELWIATLLVFLITLSVWWIILKIKKSPHGETFCDVLINIFSLTTCGCIRREPQIGMLRNILLMYLFYIIIIQTAFNCKLIAALTSPTDNNKIESVEDVANSKLPVCCDVEWRAAFFLESRPRDTIYTKIQNKLVLTSRSQPILPMEGKCISLITNGESFRNNHGKVSTVIDDRYARIGKGSLLFYTPHYFMTSINAAIERWKESGIFDADMEKILPKSLTKYEDDEPVVLTLQHLSGVFAIWGICMSFSFIVFSAELVVHKFFAK